MAGRRLWFPPLITVWHREPGGRDSGEVCKQHRHDPVNGWQFYHGWRFHIRHWKIQVHPFQQWRRVLLTRCTWCGGRQRKGDPINVSRQWDEHRGPWWRGERGLFHQDCSSVSRAKNLCYCVVPVLDHVDYGRCEVCHGHRAFRREPSDADRMLNTLPQGARIPATMKPLLEDIWRELREAQS